MKYDYRFVHILEHIQRFYREYNNFNYGAAAIEIFDLEKKINSLWKKLKEGNLE